MTPNFRREMRVGAFLFLTLLAALWGSLEDAAEAQSLLYNIPQTRGPLACRRKTVVLSAHLTV